MIKKYCSKCKNTSFSACREVWICPYCSEDISNQPCCSINDDIIINRNGNGDIVASEKLRLVSGSHN